MKRCVQTDIVFQVMELLTGEKHRAIEAAKRLIAEAERVDPDLLSRVVADSEYKPWSKVMAAYVLGFLSQERGVEHAGVLRSVVADLSLPVRLRDFSAEALGNLNDEGAASVLSERLFDEKESRLVRKSCLYALSQLRSLAATSALSRFALTEPEGLLARELDRSTLASV